MKNHKENINLLLSRTALLHTVTIFTGMTTYNALVSNALEQMSRYIKQKLSSASWNSPQRNGQNPMEITTFCHTKKIEPNDITAPFSTSL